MTFSITDLEHSGPLSNPGKTKFSVLLVRTREFLKTVLGFSLDPVQTRFYLDLGHTEICVILCGTSGLDGVAV